MGVSAVQWANEKGERYRAGQTVVGDYYWSREAGRWLLFDSYIAAGIKPSAPPPSSPPAREVVRALAPWVAVAGVAGLGLWWWRK